MNTTPQTGTTTQPGHSTADKAVRVLYIGGVGRSGSTLLDRILGQAPGLFSIGEVVHLWQRGLRDNQQCGCGQPFHDCSFWSAVGDEAYGGWSQLDAHEMVNLQHAVDRNRYIPLLISPSGWPAYHTKLERWATVLDRLYRAIKTVSGADVIVDSTKHASYAYLLRRVPGVDLRLVHLVRDSHGVAYSWTKEVPKPEVIHGGEHMPRYHPVQMSARWMSYNLLFHGLVRLGVPALFARYESVVADPRAEVGRMLDLAGYRPAARDLDYIHDGAVELAPSHTVAGNPMRFKQGRLVLRRDEEWRARLSPVHRRQISALTWPLLRRYGYRRQDPQVTS